MCQRKIIGKGILKIVPVDPGPNGCKCPTITQIRDIDKVKAERSKYKIQKCIDVKTQLKTDEGLFISFRYCVCNYPSGICGILPPTYIFPNTPQDDDTDEDEGYGENNGGGYSWFPK